MNRRLLLVPLFLAGLAAALIPAIPFARADQSYAQANLVCGNQMSITFEGFVFGSLSDSASVTVIEDGQSTTSQYAFVGSATEDLGTATPGHTWEIQASWDNSHTRPPGPVGSYDSGAVTCQVQPQTTTTTQVTVSAPTTTAAATTPVPPAASATTTVETPTTTITNNLTTTIESDTTTIEATTTAIAPSPPTVDFTASASAGVGEVKFAGSETAGANPIHETIWNFGDGSAALDLDATHTYKQPGTYVVTLTAIDSAGLTGIAAYEVTVTENGTIMGARVPAFAIARTAKKVDAARAHSREAFTKPHAKPKPKKARKPVKRR